MTTLEKAKLNRLSNLILVQRGWILCQWLLNDRLKVFHNCKSLRSTSNFGIASIPYIESAYNSAYCIYCSCGRIPKAITNTYYLLNMGRSR